MIALAEAIDRDGAVRQSWRIERWPVTIGRALDNDIVLGDPHIAAHHARVDAAPAGTSDVATLGTGDAGSTAAPAVAAAAPTLTVTAGDTRNGLAVGKHRLVAGASRELKATPGHDLELHLGRTSLRLRLAGAATAPELVLAPVAGAELRWPATLALAAAVVGAILFSTWLATDPDELSRAVGRSVLSTLALFATWCGAWALLSKIVARQGHLGWHVRVAFGAALLMLGLSVLPALLAFAFSWPWATDFAFVAVYAVAAGAIYLHLLAVEPARPRLMRGVAAAGFCAAVAVSIWFNVQRTGRPGEELYMNHLFPPALRGARPVAVDRFVDGLAPMQAVLDRQARERGEGTGPDEGDDDE